MNRRIFYAVMLMLVFTSCKKYEVTEPLDLSTLPTATIQGTLYADLDLTNAILEYVPEGTKVTVSIPYADYDLTNASGGNYVLTTTIDKKGSFTINIPVVSSGVNANVSFDAFNYNVIQGITEDTMRIWTQFNLPSKLIAGVGSGSPSTSTKIEDTYNVSTTDPNGNTFNPTTKIKYSGTLDYLAEHKNYTQIIGTDTITRDTMIFKPVPKGTVINVQINTVDEFGRDFLQQKTYTVSTAGKFELDIPMVKNGYAQVAMDGEEIWDYEERILGKTYVYKYDLSVFETLYFVDYTTKKYSYSQDVLIYEKE